MRVDVRVLSLAFAVAPLSACPPEGECQAYNDCPDGQYCDDGQCVDDVIIDGGPPRDGGGNGGGDAGPPYDAGPEGDGGAGGGGGVLHDVRTTYDVPWIQWDPTNANRILYHEQSMSGDTVLVDRVLALDTTTGTKVSGTIYELTTMSDGPCHPDSIVFEPVAGETWFNCHVEPGLRIVYNGNIAQPTQNETDTRAEVILSVPGATGADLRRLLVATRGGSLVSFRVQSFDSLGTPRQRDGFQSPVGGVQALFPLAADGVPGTHVLVHERASDPGHLVPLTRDVGTEEWRPTDALASGMLPEGAHAVVVIAPISADGNSSSPNDPNYATLHPETGEMRFWNFEEGQEIFPKTNYETDSRFFAAPPDVEERLLLAPSPSGDHVFYAFKNSDKIWRIPLVPGADNDVLGFELEDLSREISALLVESDDTVWVSYDNDNLIEHIRLVDPS